MRLSLNRIVLLTFGLVLVLTAVPEVFAHAKLVRSQPSAKATLKESPKTVELWFSEELEPQFSTIVVTDQSDKQVDKNDVSPAEGNKKLQISLEDLPSGLYTVDWKALSTDQHTMKGTFTFTVAATSAAQTPPSPRAAATTTQPPNQNGASPVKSESMEESGSSWIQSVVRWFEYLTMMMLFGGFAFYLFVLKPAIQQSHGLTDIEKGEAAGKGARCVVLFSGLSLAILILASLAELVLQAATVFDKTILEALSPSLLSQVIKKTGFGAAWRLEAWAIFGLLILVIYMFRRSSQQSTKEHTVLEWAGLVASAVLLIAPTWTGHAAAAAKEYPFSKTTDWLHLAAGGVWVGGLFHLALTLPKTVSSFKIQDRLRVLHRVIPLFTRLAVVSTIVIVLTGVYNSWMHIDGFSKLWSTNYGKTLSLKVLLVIPMLILGGVNTFIFHPQASRLIETHDSDSESNAALDRNFSRSIRIEALLGVAVLLVASILVFEQPAREHPEDANPQSSTSQQIKN